MTHPDDPNYCTGVVGCGAMGQGIAQVSAQGGMRTILFDANPGGAERAREQISNRINRMAEKGRITEEDAASAIGRLEIAAVLADLAPCDAVVEAIFEDLEVKRTLFGELEAVLRPDAIIASNTSSIPIASIALGCARRDRIGGLHFFNPVPLMKLVEVIRAAQTSDQTVAALMALGKRMTRVPVEVKDSPGFLVNMGGRAYTTEALRIVHEGVATPSQVDAIMRDCWGFRMGPFELMDMTGIDVNYPVSRIVAAGYMDDPRLKTSPNHTAMHDAGLFGRKTGQGWFAYQNGKPLDRPSPDADSSARPMRRVSLGKGMAFAETDDVLRDELEGLVEFCTGLGLEVVDDDGIVPIVAAPLGCDASHECAFGFSVLGRGEIDAGIERAVAARVVCIDTLGDTSSRVTLMTAPGAAPEIAAGLAAAIAEGGRKVTLIKDSPGFIGQRMVAMVANLGCYMAEIGLASPEDIDTAMQLGLNYPRGSVALGEFVGAEDLFGILSAMHELTGEDRYRPTQWLRRRAQLELSLYTPN